MNALTGMEKFSHLGIDIFGQIQDILIVAIRPDAVGLVVDLDAYRLLGHMTVQRLPAHCLRDISVYHCDGIEHSLDLELDRVPLREENR